MVSIWHTYRCNGQGVWSVYGTRTDVMVRGCGQYMAHVQMSWSGGVVSIWHTYRCNGQGVWSVYGTRTDVMVRGCGQYMAHVQMSWSGGVVSIWHTYRCHGLGEWSVYSVTHVRFRSGSIACMLWLFHI